MTSNLGAQEMMAMLQPRVGFVGAPPAVSSLGGRIEAAATEAARRKFTPEFLNRIDKLLVFHPLGNAELRRILDIELDRVRDRLAPKRFEFALSDRARTFLLEHNADPRYGARHLKRTLEYALVNPLANLLASGQVTAGDLLRVDCDRRAHELTFYKENAEEAAVVARAA
jgi:ATP-dependent Clp protease ATP-binding subunit ClpA